jgi:hypothetical protein
MREIDVFQEYAINLLTIDKLNNIYSNDIYK